MDSENVKIFLLCEFKVRNIVVNATKKNAIYMWIIIKLHKNLNDSAKAMNRIAFYLLLKMMNCDNIYVQIHRKDVQILHRYTKNPNIRRIYN